jgi:hypothetical protein
MKKLRVDAAVSTNPMDGITQLSCQTRFPAFFPNFSRVRPWHSFYGDDNYPVRAKIFIEPILGPGKRFLMRFPEGDGE